VERLAFLREWTVRLLSAIRPRRTDRDLEEELRLHLELLAEDERRRGSSGSVAREAFLRAGGLAQAMESVRDQRGLPWLDDLVRDLRHGFHLLRRSPIFAAAAVASLALGVGANVAIFSFADALLLRPLGVPRPAELLTVGSTDASGGGLHASYPEYVDARDHRALFEGLAGFTDVGAVFATEPGDSPRLSIGMLVSGNFFRVLGLEPQVGRDFREEEHRAPGRDPVVILGDAFWRRELGADESILGRAVWLNGTPFTVIGIAPAGFTGMDQYTTYQFYAPLMMWPRLATEIPTDPLSDRGFRSLTLKGRLASGVTLAEAREELSRIGRDWERDYPQTSRNRTVTVRTELENRRAQAPPVPLMMSLLGALAVSVLLVACANVAGLLASRAPVRAREVALRMAMGAGSFRVGRQLVTESVLIAALGSALGLGVAFAGLVLLRQIRFPTELPIGPTFSLDARALTLGLLAGLASAVLFGLLPAIRASRADLNVVMKPDPAAAGGRKRQSWLRAALVSGQVAVAVVLLSTAAFVHRSFERRLAEGPGFRTDRILLMTLNPGLLGYEAASARQLFEHVMERTLLTPGVESVAMASYVPMDGRAPWIAVAPEGVELEPGEDSPVLHAAVSEDYFETLGIPILRGRGFRPSDDPEAPDVAVVNELFAERYWPRQDAVGKRLRLGASGEESVEIVGIAMNSKYGFVSEVPREFLYLPFRQRPQTPLILFARSAGEPSGLVEPLRAIVRGLDAGLPLYNVRTFEEFYRMRVTSILGVIRGLIVAMGAIGLVLALIGLYALVAYEASRRTKEIGIRVAIGASRTDVLKMVLRQGLFLALSGIAVGLVASTGADNLLGATFAGGPGVSGRTDVGGLALVSAAVTAVTLFAVYVPARRAARMNPTDTLRCE
jgi:predicted permease